MEKINFSIEIKAKPSVVWEKLWSDENYPIWTSVFDEGSRAESDWKEGSKIIFLSSSGHGMVSEIDINRPYETMSFRHLGNYFNGKEDTESPSVKEWAGAMETYHLEEHGDATVVHVELDIQPSERASMEKIFPEALVRLKELAESDAG